MLVTAICDSATLYADVVNRALRGEVRAIRCLGCDWYHVLEEELTEQEFAELLYSHVHDSETIPDGQDHSVFEARIVYLLGLYSEIVKVAVNQHDTVE